MLKEGWPFTRPAVVTCRWAFFGSPAGSSPRIRLFFIASSRAPRKPSSRESLGPRIAVQVNPMLSMDSGSTSCRPRRAPTCAGRSSRIESGGSKPLAELAGLRGSTPRRWSGTVGRASSVRPERTSPPATGAATMAAASRCRPRAPAIRSSRDARQHACGREQTGFRNYFRSGSSAPPPGSGEARLAGRARSGSLQMRSAEQRRDPAPPRPRSATALHDSAKTST
jgi:hypothetical protein